MGQDLKNKIIALTIAQSSPKESPWLCRHDVKSLLWYQTNVGQGGTINSDFKNQGRSSIAWILKDYG